MDDPDAALDPDLIYGLYAGGFKPQVVRIALLLDLFTPLANGPADPRAVAQACDCEETSVRALLDYLSCLQLVERQGKSYNLTPTAAAFLVPGQKTYAGDWVLMETGSELWDGVLQRLHGNRPAYPAIPWAQDAWLESHRRSRVPESIRMWHAAGIEPGQRPGLQVLDLACGCAIKSLVLAQTDETVHITCVDTAEVLEVARDLAQRLRILSQVTFLPGDLLSAHLGAERYGAALLGQVTDYLTPKQNIGLFQQIHRALLPNGVLVIDVPMASETPDQWVCLTSLLAWAVSDGGAHSFADYCDWLERAGFGQVRQLSEQWLAATK